MGAIIAAISRLCCCSDEPEAVTDAGDIDAMGVELAANVTRASYAPSSSGRDEYHTIEANSSDNPSECRSVSNEQLNDHPGELECVRSASSPGDNDTIETSSSDNSSECRSVSSEQLDDHPGELEHVRSASSPDDNAMRAADHTGANSHNSFVECLTESRVRIVGELDELDDILGYLVSNHAISKIQIDVIMTQKKGRNKVRELLDCVHRRGEEACRSLVAALRDTEQIQLCELSASLKEELDKVPVRNVLSIDQYMTEMKGTYQQMIQDRNEQEQTQYGNSISLVNHAPVIINHGDTAPDAQTRQGFDEFHIEKTERKQLTLDGIFLKDTDRRRPHSVLLLGGPGMGKTSLCFTILNRFACGQWGGHHFIFLMLLKELGDMGQSLTLADLLFDYNQPARTKKQKKRLIRQLQKRPERILFIFDGYDECDEFMTDTLIISDPLAKAHSGTILRSLVRGKLLPKSQLLLTSRPFRRVDMKVDRVVELAGLSNQSVSTLLGEFLVGEMESETAAFFMNHEDVVSMLSIPINIQKFISYLIWLRHSGANILPNLPKTKSSLYSKQMLLVLTHNLRLRHIHLFSEDEIWRHELVHAFLIKLAKLASSSFNQFGKNLISFQPKDLDTCGLTEEDVKTGGLMSMFKKQITTPNGIRHLVFFFFNHLTTLEWCGGLDTASRDIDHIANLIDHNNGSLDVVLIFCAGLLGTTEGQLILERLYDIPKDKCNQKALSIMMQIVHSDRCRKPGGPQFAIEVFSEASFVDPRPLLPLLAPDEKTLEIADIALSNRQAVGYFIEQLNSSQDEQTGATGTPGSEICLDTVRLHFNHAADCTVQKSMVSEVGKMEKLKHLLIETDGDCKAVVERPLDMLMVKCGGMTKNSAVHIIETSRASMLCLYSDDVDGHSLPRSTRLSKDVQEIHLLNVYLHRDTLISMASTSSTSSLRAVTGLRYNDVTAAAIHRIIQYTPDLQAVGLWLVTRDVAAYNALLRVVSASSIECLSLWLDPYIQRHMEVIKEALDNTSLRELWLMFIYPPRDSALFDLAQRLCRQGCLIRLSLVCLSGISINVGCFLRQLVKEPHSIHHIYTDDNRSVDCDVVRRFTGDLHYVRGLQGVFFTPLVYSDYLLTSIPSHVKKVLTRRYVSPT